MSDPAAPDLLVVEDDADVRASLERGLALSGFAVRSAQDGPGALRAVHERVPDAVVLDLGLPGMDGVAVVTALRAMDHDVPVCVLSARDTVDDRVVGLEAGADDYMVKPFALTELVARLRALLRRGVRPAPSAPSDGDVVAAGPLRIDLARRTVHVGERSVDLTKREYELLVVLARNADVVLTRERLLELVWGYDFATDTNVVDVFVGYLRRKLEADGTPRLVHTVRGVGFVLREGG
ncbi:winged helix family two component transcriptional regulator [Actinomycetospora succinea]|uniref:Winged helix family two component transcriptional regulator n=1 Tax=Actinomycetospora succinea TaxID=663603 RepID=A0A4R6VIS0_9PSEU|nr:response regulator transcription factor [Actinomycetospora succinea]TDQ63268.1 winged helix family two component transcriptional regulator [Actinomycetospora succinea]